MAPSGGALRKFVFVVAGVALLVAPTACGGDDRPDPEAAKAPTATGELVGSALANAVAQLRQVMTADPTLTVGQAFARTDASLSEAGYAIDDMLDRKGLALADMMLLFAEGVASRLPPVAGVVVEPSERPTYEKDYKGDERRSIMRAYANQAVIRAMLVDNGPPRPFRSLFIGDKPPPTLSIRTATSSCPTSRTKVSEPSSTGSLTCPLRVPRSLTSGTDWVSSE